MSREKMTIDEAIAIIRKEYLCVDRDCDIERNCGKCDLMMPSKEPILKAYKMAIQALEQGHWIPVSERLPEIGQYVLCSLIKAKDVKHRVIICEYKREVWWSYVTAWQPLPQPYKAGK